MTKGEELWNKMHNIPGVDETSKVSELPKELQEQIMDAVKEFTEYMKSHPEDPFFDRQQMQKRNMEEENRQIEKNTSVHMNGDIIITDPCYIIKDEIWHKLCRIYFGPQGPKKVMEYLKQEYGFTNGFIVNTLYGDWSCTTYEVNDLASALKDGVKEENITRNLGSFCADAGLVCVLYLDECLKHNKDKVEELLKKDWCATVIKNFDGDVYIRDKEETYYSEYLKKDVVDISREVIGQGNINFIGTQTGL